MKKTDKIKESINHTKKIIRLLKREYPEAKTALVYKNPHQLLVATILSAQSTDEQVNKVTERLFKKYKNPRDFAKADLEELQEDIHSTGFFRNKAKAIKESSKVIVEKHNGKIPEKLEELVKLPGVGRKTASVVLGAAFNRAEGIVVDTHVKRLSGRLGLSDKKDPEKIERDLMELVPKKDWIIFSHLLIHHGRAICKARRPNCPECLLNKICPTAKEYL